MSYRDRQRLADIEAAIDAIRSHLDRGDLSDGLTVDGDLPELEHAIQALSQSLPDDNPPEEPAHR